MMWWLFPAVAVYMMIGGFVGGVIEEDSDEEGWVGMFWPLVLLFWVVAGFWKLGATVQGLPRARRERAASAARARALRAAKARKRSKELEQEMGLQPLPFVPASADGDEGLHVGNCGVTPHRREDCELPRRDLSPEPDLPDPGIPTDWHTAWVAYNAERAAAQLEAMEGDR